jgi:integrase
MSIQDAFDSWIPTQIVSDQPSIAVRYLEDTSISTYREYVWALEKFFGKMPLRKIHDGHIRSFQDDRANCRGSWRRKAGQNRIRKEVGFLLRIMRIAQVWDEDHEVVFKMLPPQLTDVPRALDPDQQKHLLAVMSRREEWEWIYHYTVIALRTCAAPIEIRQGRLKDINLLQRTFRVGPEASKNKFRNRTIPLEKDDVVESFIWLLKRAERFGAFKPDHFFLPFGVGSNHRPDPGKPMTRFGLKDGWNEIRKVSGFIWFRPYDLRHTAITRMAEEGTPIAIIMAFAGHISPKMQQHYTTISMQAKRSAARAMPDVPPKKPPMSVRELPESSLCEISS